jgi:hypothetical protein
MALQTKIVVTCHEKFVVNRAVYLVARLAALTQGLVFKDVGSRLLAVTLSADAVPRRHKNSLRLIDGHPVRVVAIDTGNPSLPEGMVVLEVERRPYFRMAVEACLRIRLGIDDVYPSAPASIHMEAARSVAYLTSLPLETFRIARDTQAGMIRVLEGPDGIFVAERTRVGSHILGTRDFPGRRHYEILVRCAGKNECARHHGN